MKIKHLIIMLIAVLMVQNTSEANSTLSADKPSELIQSNSGVDYSAMDLSTRPQDDFFAYVNGEWLKQTQIPSDKFLYGNFEIIYDRTQDQLNKIIQDAAQSKLADGESAQKLGHMYNSFINKEAVNRLRFKPLLDELKSIDKVKDRAGIAKKMGQLSSLGVAGPLAFWVYPDAKQPSKYALWMYQSGLTLPNRSYYLNKGSDFTKHQQAFKKYATNVLIHIGYSDAQKRAENIYALERKIAIQQMDNVTSQDAKLNYNKLSKEQLAQLLKTFDWHSFATGAGISANQMIVENLSFFKGFSKVYSTTSLATWKDYLAFNLVEHYAKYMHDDLVNTHFNFHATSLTGVQKSRPRWQRAVASTNKVLGGVLGEEYIKEYFSPKTQETISVLVQNLLKSFEDSIQAANWMSETTKKAALIKLSNITAKIGYPDKWRSYRALIIKENDLVGNIKRSYQFENKFWLDKVGKNVDKSYWMFMSPQSVDAYYSAVENEIVFPAAIFQPPFFDPKVDDAVNYGSIGWFIGHEIGHAFDDQGAKYDDDGNLANWWTDEDFKRFEILGKKLAKQYSKFEVLPNLYLNAELTKSENMGDLTGILIALKAYKKSLGGKAAPQIDGFTGEQRLFMGYAQMWRTKLTQESVKLILTNDQHAPPKYRVNGPLKHVAQFYEAFDVKAGDGMYLPVKDRVSIW